MRGVRGASFALAAVLAGGLWAGASLADAPGAPDYLFRLPEHQWAVGSTLSGDRDSCAPEACEAGYHAGDLVLSVRRSSSELQAVAQVRGCGPVASRPIHAADLTGMSSFDKYTVISRAALSVARAARTRCGSGVSDLIDTQALVAVVPGSGWPY
jgi:hypothetical protein